VRGGYRAVSVRRGRLPFAAVIPAGVRRFDAGRIYCVDATVRNSFAVSVHMKVERGADYFKWRAMSPHEDEYSMFVQVCDIANYNRCIGV